MLKHRFTRVTATILAGAMLGGCATIDGAHVVATPWGAGGLYSFKDNIRRSQDAPVNRKAVDEQVAKALDGAEQQDDKVQVATR